MGFLQTSFDVPDAISAVAIIVHGKGYRSKDKPVIKPMVNRWLRAADNVLALHSAQAKDGGSGAVYILFS